MLKSCAVRPRKNSIPILFLALQGIEFIAGVTITEPYLRGGEMGRGTEVL